MEYTLKLPNKKAGYYWIDIGLSICGIILFTLGTYVLGILMLLMALFGFLIRREPKVILNNSGVKVTGLWVTFYSWNKFQRILLKDGMLTLDFTSNKLFQESILPSSAESVNENEFNEFCRNMIANVNG